MARHRRPDDRKLHTRAGAAVYAARTGIVEPVFGQIKQARGFRQFLLRGFEQVQAEWSLVCTTRNILKLYRLCWEQRVRARVGLDRAPRLHPAPRVPRRHTEGTRAARGIVTLIAITQTDA